MSEITNRPSLMAAMLIVRCMVSSKSSFPSPLLSTPV